MQEEWGEPGWSWLAERRPNSDLGVLRGSKLPWEVAADKAGDTNHSFWIGLGRAFSAEGEAEWEEAAQRAGGVPTLEAWEVWGS